MDPEEGPSSKSSSYHCSSDKLIRVPTLDFISLISLTISSLEEYWKKYSRFYRQNYHFPRSFVEDLGYSHPYSYWGLREVTMVIVLAVLMTKFRETLTTEFIVPWSIRLQISKANSPKMPESVWKLIFYSLAWCWSWYVLIYSGKYNIFNDPLSIWDHWSRDMVIPWEVLVAYLIQTSFYVHSIYGTVYMDVWRKDSAVMIVHHFLTIVLIVFSYSTKHHEWGMIVLFLHDLSDFLLEITKLNVYLKNRGGRYYWIHDVISNIGFACFGISWFVCRLWLFPGKVMYAGVYGSVKMAPPDIPFLPVFCTLLTALLIMNAWWFHFILILLYKVASGQMKEIDDTREFESDSSSEEDDKKTK